MAIVDVIIPARNEAATIGDIIECLGEDNNIGQILVAADSCTDGTGEWATMHGATIVRSEVFGGKGQGARAMLAYVKTERVMFCDADYTGLTQSHIAMLTEDYEGMIIGIADMPRELKDFQILAWPWVSGIRVVPTAMVWPLKLHGYLMETQINRAAKYSNTPYRFKWLDGLKSPWRMSEKRLTDMVRDAQWGKRHGII